MSKKLSNLHLASSSASPKKLDQSVDRSDLAKQILLQTELQIVDKFSDKALDTRREKIELLSGRIIFPNEIKDVVSISFREYAPRFPQVYYLEIARLNGWDEKVVRRYYKPVMVARFTNELIYNRFQSDVLPRLQQLNPFVSSGIRRGKHFQWLTQPGQILLDQYIDDAVNMMKECKTWYEFKFKHAKKFGLPLQLDLFEKRVD